MSQIQADDLTAPVASIGTAGKSYLLCACTLGGVDYAVRIERNAYRVLTLSEDGRAVVQKGFAHSRAHLIESCGQIGLLSDRLTEITVRTAPPTPTVAHGTCEAIVSGSGIPGGETPGWAHPSLEILRRERLNKPSAQAKGSSPQGRPVSIQGSALKAGPAHLDAEAAIAATGTNLPSIYLGSPLPGVVAFRVSPGGYTAFVKSHKRDAGWVTGRGAGFIANDLSQPQMMVPGVEALTALQGRTLSERDRDAIRAFAGQLPESPLTAFGALESLLTSGKETSRLFGVGKRIAPRSVIALRWPQDIPENA